MFYLLEDNRIIDSKIPYAHAKSLPFGENKAGHLCAKDRIGKSYQVFKYDKIKNQSENVFDLIEKGDLVRCLNDIYEIKHVYHDNDSFVTDFVTSGCGICFPSWGKFLKELNAIYKPDDKGNYIKVWERKEENESCNGTD